jgi:hypothetical protein
LTFLWKIALHTKGVLLQSEIKILSYLKIKKMTYQIVLFAIFFVLTALAHKPFNAHTTKRVWFKTFHYWLECTVVIQAIIILNEYLKTLN